MNSGPRPTVKRFSLKKTYAGRTVKRTVVNHAKRPTVQVRKGIPLKALKKGR